MPKITKRAVDAVMAANKDVYIWDQDLKGFGLKVTPAGRRVFLVQYRTTGNAGRTRRITLGTYGEITADQARSEAQAVLRMVARNEDPMATYDMKKSEQTTGELLEDFMKVHVLLRLKPRSKTEYQRLVDKLLSKSFLRKPITEIQKSDISSIHNGLAETPYQANRLIAVLKKFFNWCEAEGFRPNHTNPVMHVKNFGEEQRKRYLTSDEMTALGEVLSQYEQSGRFGPYVIAALRLLSLTGARLGEIRTLKWDWVDFDNQVLNLPESKTGAKSIHLSAPALQILRALPRMENNPHVICGEKKGAHLVNLQKPWTEIRKKAGIEDVRIHDLRHSFASIAVASGMSLPMIGALLGHSQPQTTARYAHLASEPLKVAVSTIGAKMDQIAGTRLKLIR